MDRHLGPSQEVLFPFGFAQPITKLMLRLKQHKVYSRARGCRSGNLLHKSASHQGVINARGRNRCWFSGNRQGSSWNWDATSFSFFCSPVLPVMATGRVALTMLVHYSEQIMRLKVYGKSGLLPF